MALVWDTGHVQEGRIQDNCASRDQRGPNAEDHFSKLNLKPAFDRLGKVQILPSHVYQGAKGSGRVLEDEG